MSVPVHIHVNAANEGIPVASIARITQTPLDETYTILIDAKDRGLIVDMPRPDWPPGTKVRERIPGVTLPSDGDLQFMCANTFRLTQLEAAFLVTLLKNRQVEKTRLHGIVEHQRNTRMTQLDKKEATDPKMVDVMICKLRKKMKTVDASLKIATMWGSGYFIDVEIKPRIIAHLNGGSSAPQENSIGSTPMEAARAAGDDAAIH